MIDEQLRDIVIDTGLPVIHDGVRYKLSTVFVERESVVPQTQRFAGTELSRAEMVHRVEEREGFGDVHVTKGRERRVRAKVVSDWRRVFEV